MQLHSESCLACTHVQGIPNDDPLKNVLKPLNIYDIIIDEERTKLRQKAFLVYWLCSYVCCLFFVSFHLPAYEAGWGASEEPFQWREPKKCLIRNSRVCMCVSKPFSSSLLMRAKHARNKRFKSLCSLESFSFAKTDKILQHRSGSFFPTHDNVRELSAI